MVYKTVEVVRDRYVAVPAALTDPVDTIPLSPGFDIYELGAVAKAREVRLLQCNGKLLEISRLE